MCLGVALPPHHPSLVGECVEGVLETQASQLARRQELLPLMKWLLKSFKNGIFSWRRQQSVWGGGEQDTESPCTVLRRQHSLTSWGGGAEEPPTHSGRAWEGKRLECRLGWGHRGGVQAGELRPGFHASASVYVITFKWRPHHVSDALPGAPPRPHASPLGAEQEDHMERIIRQLTFH